MSQNLELISITMSWDDGDLSYLCNNDQSLWINLQKKPGFGCWNGFIN